MRTVLLATLAALSTNAFAAKEKFDPRTIDKVAIFAFGGTIEIEQPEDGSGKGIMAAIQETKAAVDDAKALADGSMKEKAEGSAHTAFRTVDSGLEAAFGWQVVDLDVMLANAEEQRIWDEKTPGINKKMSGWGAGMAPKGILFKDLAGTVKQEDRDKLAESLGVDYVAVVGMYIKGDVETEKINKKKVPVVYPSAYTRVKVFKKGEKKPIWKGGGAGKQTEDPITPDGMGGPDDRSAIILAAVQNSLDKMKVKYAPEG